VTVRRLRIYLASSVLVAVFAVGGAVASGDDPVLGLDLQGGISIVLEPVGRSKPAALDVSVDIIRSRVDALGVAEPEVSRRGNTIVIDLPGVKERGKARRLVGQTAELRFRPVLADLPPEGATPTSTTAAPGASTTASTAATTTTTQPADDDAITAAIAACDDAQIQALVASAADIPSTTRADDSPFSCVALPTREGALRLLLDRVPCIDLSASAGALVDACMSDETPGVAATGRLVADAKARFSQGVGWAVTVDFTSDGAQQWDALAAQYVGSQLAIVLDGKVQSAPVIQEANFGGTAEITGDFTQEEAEDLETVIDYGALPVELEELSVDDVSPTLGKDQLRAGVAAGIIGLALVALYMLLYYRLLGLVVVLGLLLAGAITYALIIFFGATLGLTLTLAGVTGLIVSVGVTVDSYVVYFERLKDELRVGKTVRSSVDRGFKRAFRTILAADLVSLIGAAALYLLAIGPVRGFAFFLGLEIALDLLVSYFFMYPLVALLARRPALVRMRGVGIAAGLDRPEVTT
jgi:preprotein translocase subunit SecD